VQGSTLPLADDYAVKLSKHFKTVCSFPNISIPKNIPENTSEGRLCAEFVASLMLLANLNA
jgi:hypothetical protein